MLQLKRKNKGDNRDKERKGKREREGGLCVGGVFACKRGSCKREKGLKLEGCVGVFKSMKGEEVKVSMREGDERKEWEKVLGVNDRVKKSEK